ncbi:MAG: isoleucine--tRNA ligase [archaeon]
MEQFKPQETEEKILKYWKDGKIFEKVQKLHEKDKKWYFNDGPPYTTGNIHLGTAWNKVLKDSILRYKRMQGYSVRSQPGYDMHGLPIEVKVEELMGIKNKKEIETGVGMDKFIDNCRKFALDNLAKMNEQFARLGVWMDWDKPYRTIDDSYIEGAWWALKKAHDKGLLFTGPRSVTWCWRCATALAKHELEYETVTDSSVYVKFQLRGKKNEYVLIWTTTPWTLPMNMMVAVHPDFDYAKIKVGDEYWILAKPFVIALMGMMEKKYEVVETLKGSELKGIEYVNPFAGDMPVHEEMHKKYPNAYTIQPVSDEMFYGFVTLSAGSGCVHTAPGCGAEDFDVGRKLDIPAFTVVEENGDFNELGGKYQGWNASKDNTKFIDVLKEKGILAMKTPVSHEYAHCWRCKSPIIYRATEQWYLGVSKMKDKLIAENKKVKWSPDWAGERWFRDWLENIQDWCISRQRYWGIPLPIWRCENNHVKVIGSRAELNADVKELHRPHVDKVTFKCEECGKEMRRIPDILDVWLDSGAATWASLGFPKDETEFKKLWPADFITEGKDQIRGWFNSQLCLSMVSHGVTPYKNVYMHGFISDEKGAKMSKSLGNVIEPSEVIEKIGSEAWRLYCLGASRSGEDLRVNWKDMDEAYKALNILWNVAQFAKYMDVEGFNPEEFKLDTKKLKPEDKWIISRINTLNQQVTQAFEDMEFPDAPPLLRDFMVEDLSRWYIKLIRDRTWVSAKGSDKLTAFKVLYDVLKQYLILAAPILPILTEELYQAIVKPLDKKAPESIHMLSWPKPDSKKIDAKLEEEMKIARSIVEASFFAREEAKVKLRWPLKTLAVEGDDKVKKALKTFEQVIKTQANVKELKAGSTKGIEKEFEFGKLVLDNELTPAILEEALAREVMRAVQVLRKKNEFKVDEKINVTFSSSDEFARRALNKFREEIVLKVGAEKIDIAELPVKAKVSGECKFEDKEISIGFDKAK